MALTQLIYVSDLVPGQQGQIGSILESAVRHNQQDGITGMLLYSEGNFLQVLEGEHDQVKATYQRIAKDPRHQNLIMLSEEEVAHRHFANWSMGYRQMSPEDIRNFPSYAPFFQFGFRNTKLAVEPGLALEMLEMFSKGMM